MAEGRAVTWSDTVTVLPIPTRTEYGELKDILWHSASTLNHTAYRNAVEANAERVLGVVEEEGFVRTVEEPGELIHPGHFMGDKMFKEGWEKGLRVISKEFKERFWVGED